MATELEILGQNYSAQVQKLDNGLLRNDRSHIYPTPFHVDAFASYWCLGYLNGEPGSVFIRSRADWVPLEGPCLIYLPPFSIVEWKVQPGKLIKWTLFSSTKPLPFSAARRGLFKVDRVPFNNCGDIFNWIKKIQESGTEIYEGRGISAVASRLKKWLDCRFLSDAKITVAAQELGYSRVVMSRAFQKEFGLSPTDYRHRLRIFEAIAAMNDGKSITEAFTKVGYADSSQFVIQFRKYLGEIPTSYSWSKKKRRVSKSILKASHEGSLVGRQ